MKCDVGSRQLEQYLDGRLAAGARDAIEEHLVRCAACARYVAEARRLRSLLATLPPREVGADFEMRLASRLAQAPRASLIAAWWQRLRFYGAWRLMPTMAAAGAVVAGLLLATFLPRQPAAPPSPSPAALAPLREFVEGHQTLAAQSEIVERVVHLPGLDALETSLNVTSGLHLTD